MGRRSETDPGWLGCDAGKYCGETGENCDANSALFAYLLSDQFDRLWSDSRAQQEVQDHASHGAQNEREIANAIADETLVEGFDIAPYSDFSAKRSNFMGLVLCCIDAKFWNKIFVGKLSTRSTRFTNVYTAPHPKIQLNFVKHFRMFTMFFKSSPFFRNFVQDITSILTNIWRNSEFQQICRKRSKYPGFSNFLRFRTENCWILQEIVVAKLRKKLDNKLEVRKKPF